MANNLLQTYLNKQFIRTSDEGNISHLKKAVTEVSKRLSKNKNKVILYTLVAINPLISENDPVVLEVERIIISKWSAFKNGVTQTQEKPTTYIRAVILGALEILAKKEEYAALIWHTSRDVISYYNTSKESEFLGDFLIKLGNDVEERSLLYWSINNLVELDDSESPNISLKAVKSSAVNEKNLEIHLLDAAQFTQWKQYSDNVGSNPSQLNNQLWAPHFASKAAKGLAQEFNSAFSSQSKSLSSTATQLQAELKNSTTQIHRFLNQISETLKQGAIATNKRSELLWWKQALYSPILNTTYRILEPVNSAMVMAIDLAEMVAPIYPHSVDFLLKETLKDVHGDQVDKVKPLADWIDQASNMTEEEKLLLNSLISNLEGQKPLGVALANYLNNESGQDIFSETGIYKNTEISLADLSVWLFHDLQASKIAKTK